jgi:hypothetical protein
MNWINPLGAGKIYLLRRKEGQEGFLLRNVRAIKKKREMGVAEKR